MTVREAFSLAFGPVPDGAECFVADEEGVWAICMVGKNKLTADTEAMRWCDEGETGTSRRPYFPFGPDISDRPAEAFLGFFGDEYDKVVLAAYDAGPGEQEAKDKVIAEARVVTFQERVKGNHWDMLEQALIAIDAATDKAGEDYPKPCPVCGKANVILSEHEFILHTANDGDEFCCPGRPQSLSTDKAGEGGS